MNVSTAVILAAGRGTRLAGAGLSVPKGLVEIGGEALVSRSIRLMRQRGIAEVILVTGHQSQLYELFAAGRDGVRCIYNGNFDTMGSLESLRCALLEVASPFLLLDSDILYESRGIDALQQDAGANAVLVSGPTGSGDEYYVWTDRSQNIRYFSKSLADQPEDPAGEHVGIVKVGTSLRTALLESSAARLRREPMVTYESLLVSHLSEHEVRNCFVQDLIWSEIDNAEMLATACDIVWPKLAAIGDR